MNAARSIFSLVGPSVDFEPRVQAVRPDLADVRLAGQWFAPHYAQSVSYACLPAFAAVRDAKGEQSSELLAGEIFHVLDFAAGLAWGWCGHDDYVGYVAADSLGLADHSPPVASAADPVLLAESFLGLPYVWGGRGGAGIDCSGLVQRALAGRGVAAPRDSDMQQAALGTALEENAPLQRGDLIFFPGHVGMMKDGETLIHATRHHGKTVNEPLATVIARVAEAHPVPVLARKRIAL
jgi:cell wall-associated NlpC family hydrolase